MNLLAIDSACSVLSAAVSRGEEIFYEQTEAGMKHSELVMEIINAQMEKAGLKPCDLNGILCMGGPGSFTGLRIGFSIAKGLALSLSIPFVPVPTLECIAYPGLNTTGLNANGLTLPVIQARKDAFFFALFNNGRRLMEDADGDISQIAAVIREKINRVDRKPRTKGTMFLNNFLIKTAVLKAESRKTARLVRQATGLSHKSNITGPAADALYNALPEELKPFCECSCNNTGYARELIYIAKDKNLFCNDNTAFLYSGPEYIRKTDAEINLLQSFI